MGLLNLHELFVPVAQSRAAVAKRPSTEPSEREVRGEARRHDARAELDPEAGARARAVAVVNPAAPGLPTTLMLRGVIDVVTAPGLGAMVSTAAGAGELLVDVHRVDRFDTATWGVLADGCTRATEPGGAVRIVGLRWSQVLDVLAATPVVQLAALMARMRVLRCSPVGPPASAPTGAAEGALGRRPPEPRDARARIGPRQAPTARAGADATTDHLPRDWTMADPGASRG
jgi:anti-anti-sigma regulatory factor